MKTSILLNRGDTLDYDLYRKSTRVTDAKGYVREYFYDDNGRMTRLTEPDGGVPSTVRHTFSDIRHIGFFCF